MLSSLARECTLTLSQSCDDNESGIAAFLKNKGVRLKFRFRNCSLTPLLILGQQSALGTAFDQFAAAHPGLTVTTLRSEAVFFHHESWLQLPGRPVADRAAGWTSDFPVRFWFRIEANRLALCLQMGPILSLSAENSWIALFEALAQKFEVKRAPRSTRRARVTRVNIELQDDSVQELLDAMNKAWSKLANGKASESVCSALQEWIDGCEMASLPR